MPDGESSEVEVWRPVVGYENYYSVSDKGRVRRESSAKGALVGRIIRAWKKPNGYLQVCLSVKCKVSKHHVHRLVAAAFCSPDSTRKDVNHKDGTRDNNCAINLEYMTRSENLCYSRDVLGVRLGNPHKIRGPRKCRVGT